MLLDCKASVQSAAVYARLASLKTEFKWWVIMAPPLLTMYPTPFTVMSRQADAKACTGPQVTLRRPDLRFYEVMLTVSDMNEIFSIISLHTVCDYRNSVPGSCENPCVSVCMCWTYCICPLLGTVPAWLRSLTYFLCVDGLATSESTQINCIFFS